MTRNIVEKNTIQSWVPSVSCRSAGDEDKFVIEYFGGKKNGFLLDISAADGVTGSNTFKLINEYEWSGILVEPCISHHEQLERLFGDFQEIKICKEAIHSTLKKTTFYEVERKEVGLSHTGESKHPLLKNNAFKTYEVDCLNVMEMFEKYNAPKHIDFISVDCEACENHLLPFIDYKKYNIELFCIENGESFYRDVMLSNGYEIIHQNKYKFASGNTFFRKK